MQDDLYALTAGKVAKQSLFACRTIGNRQMDACSLHHSFVFSGQYFETLCQGQLTFLNGLVIECLAVYAHMCAHRSCPLQTCATMIRRSIGAYAVKCRPWGLCRNALSLIRTLHSPCTPHYFKSKETMHMRQALLAIAAQACLYWCKGILRDHVAFSWTTRATMLQSTHACSIHLRPANLCMGASHGL